MFTPESTEEKAKLETLWRLLVDCVGYSRKLVPIGDFVPQADKKTASFHIEGLGTKESSFVEVRIDTDSDAYCKICNKVLLVKAGEIVPICCGKPMEIID
jgi:hypothetical protein